ncbi:MAG: flagellar hook-basal body complex protein [Sphingomonadales bacterium]|nr:flagellar hook-basal body complex protein [Sphingomonadales bacterium]
MSFYISLSGLKGAQTDLGVVSNNVANAGSTAFKKSRASFGDIYANTGAQGVRQVATTQQFTQGTLETTDKTLDLAMTGEGFFTVKSAPPANQLSYTRNGSFGVNNNGYVVDSLGNKVQMLPVDAYGKLTSTSAADMVDLRIPKDNGKAVMPSAYQPGSARIDDETGIVTVAFANGKTRDLTPSVSLPKSKPGDDHNLTSASVDISSGVVSATYDDGTVVALSPPLKLPPYQVDSADPTKRYMLSGATVDNDGVVTAHFAGGADVELTEKVAIPTTHQTPIPFLWAYVDDTGDVMATFADGEPAEKVGKVTIPGDDGGTPASQLASINISIEGVVSATYANGDTEDLGMLALANFTNTEGLTQNGNAHWTASRESGDPSYGEGNNGRYGAVRSGTLERSNVDITEELVALISAQRNFQANAKAIETASNMTQTIVQMRT